MGGEDPSRHAAEKSELNPSATAPYVSPLNWGEPRLQLPYFIRRRAGTLADALDASAQPPGCPRDRPRGGSTSDSVSPAHPHISLARTCEEATLGQRALADAEDA